MLGSSPRLLSAASALLERSAWASRGGLSFSGKRDLYTACGYERVLTPAHYKERYERGGIAERAVNIFPKAVWSRNISIYEVEDPNTLTSFEKDILWLIEKRNLLSEFMKADILSRQGEFGIIVIGAADGKDASLPLERVSGPEAIRFLLPLGQDKVEISAREMDWFSDRYSKPTEYEITIDDDNRTHIKNSTLGISRKKVHHSRVIHFAHELLDSKVYGKPTLRPIWNNLDNLYKLTGSGAEASWIRANPGLHIKQKLDLPDDVEIEETSEEELLDKWEEYLHGQRKIVDSAGYDVDVLSANVFNYGSNVACEMEQICATLAIPQRVFAGSERGELASSQDIESFNNRCMEEINDSEEPVLRDFVDRMIEIGAVSPPKAEKYIIQWGDEDELTEAEKIEIVGRIAEANAKQHAAGDTSYMTSDEMRDRFGNMKPLKVKEEDKEPETEPDLEEEETKEETTEEVVS